MDHVTVLHGDTHVSQQGTGTFGSRSAVGRRRRACHRGRRVIDEGKRIAAHLVEAAPEDMVQADGGFRRRKAFPTKLSPGARSPPPPTAAAFPRHGDRPARDRVLRSQARSLGLRHPRRDASASIATRGKSTIEKLVLVDDCGVVINPMIVEGQIHGGVAQGLGEALREQMLYSEDGQVQTGTFMNYAIMRAGDMPPMMLGRDQSRRIPFNPLGVKGVGECGTNGAPPPSPTP